MGFAQDSRQNEIVENLSISELRQAIAETRASLEQLPRRLIRETGGTLGHRTHRRNLADNIPWLEVDLGKSLDFDLIVLIPMATIDENQKSANFGFPLRYQITLFDSPTDSTGRVLFDSSEHPELTHANQSPLLIECPGSSAQRVRLTALQTAQDPIEDRSAFALAELMVFDQYRNVAIGKPVTATYTQSYPPIYDPSYATDGFMPFSHPRTNRKIPTNYFLVRQDDSTDSISMMLDLGEPYPIDEVRLYPVHLGNNFAVFHRTGLGFPRKFSIEASNQNDFSNATTIYETGESYYPSPGHRLAIFPAAGQTGRYVRVTANELPQDPHRGTPVMAFAEIEVVSNGHPVSRDAEVTIEPNGLEVSEQPRRLVDGLSSHGEIPLLRDWLVQLSDRNRLEQRLETLQAELAQQTIRQSHLIRWLIWCVCIAIPLITLVVLWQRFSRFRQLNRWRENLAADLHDEIGGNFSGIALLCDRITSDDNLPSTYLQQLKSIARISRESAENTRNLVQFIETPNMQGELVSKMESTAAVLLAGMSYDLDSTGTKYLQKLVPKEKWHLLMFFKEAVANIGKHSAATRAALRLDVTPHQLELSISDNGHGMKDAAVLPTHLKIRSQKLHATATIESSESGTTITLRKSI